MEKNFRDNVAAALVNRSGELLVCERIDNPGCWQFPQGGVDHGETLEQAVAREIYEEVGISAADFKILASYGPYRYGFPGGIRKRGFDGQQQTVFMVECRQQRPQISLDHYQQEFINTRWIEPASFQLDWVPSFKQQLFQDLFRDIFSIDLGK